MRARSSVGFHLLRSFHAPSRLALLFFLLDLFFFRAARLLATDGSQSPRLLAIFPTPFPLFSLAAAAAATAAAVTAAAVKEAPAATWDTGEDDGRTGGAD